MKKQNVSVIVKSPTVTHLVQKKSNNSDPGTKIKSKPKSVCPVSESMSISKPKPKANLNLNANYLDTEENRNGNGKQDIYQKEEDEDFLETHICQICSFKTLRKMDLPRHMKSHNKNKNKNQNKKKNQNQHQVPHQVKSDQFNSKSTSKSSCKFCPYQSKNSSGLQKHVELVHSTEENYNNKYELNFKRLKLDKDSKSTLKSKSDSTVTLEFGFSAESKTELYFERVGNERDLKHKTESKSVENSKPKSKSNPIQESKDEEKSIVKLEKNSKTKEEPQKKKSLNPIPNPKLKLKCEFCTFSTHSEDKLIIHMKSHEEEEMTEEEGTGADSINSTVTMVTKEKSTQEEENPPAVPSPIKSPPPAPFNCKRCSFKAKAGNVCLHMKKYMTKD